MFAHQDDEVIALGAHIASFATAYMVHVTDVVPHNCQDSQDHGFTSLQDCRAGREQELTNALRLSALEHMSRECHEIRVDLLARTPERRERAAPAQGYI